LFGRNERRSLFEEMALRHFDPLYRFAFYLTGNATDAEDLLQDTLHLAYRSFHRFRKGGDARAWLFTIARNASIDRRRRKAREPSRVPLDEEVLGSRTAGNGEPGSESWKSLPIDGEEVFHDLFGDEVNRFLWELPGEYRAALLLCDVEGLSYKEISEVLACPIGTVRSRISRARAELREKLYDYAKELGFVKQETK
jgi:RNA polymerase sigma-70 factor (ECF subfamily)